MESDDLKDTVVTSSTGRRRFGGLDAATDLAFFLFLDYKKRLCFVRLVTIIVTTHMESDTYRSDCSL